MSPRPYRLGRREAAGEQTRARVVAAARKLLLDPQGAPGFSLEAVAREAGVARMTVYYRFASKRGLLEAVFDDLAAAGRMDRLAAAFRQADPFAALSEFVWVFVRFWSSGRVLLRRLYGQAATDPELEEALRARGERRREGLRVILRRMAVRGDLSETASLDDIADVLFVLTSFETFDSLARGTRRAEEVAALLQRLALGAVREFARD